MQSSLYQDLHVVLDVKSNMSFFCPFGVVVQALARTAQHPRAIPITRVIIDGISSPPFPIYRKSFVYYYRRLVLLPQYFRNSRERATVQSSLESKFHCTLHNIIAVDPTPLRVFP